MNEPKNAVGTGPDPGAVPKRRYPHNAVTIVSMGIIGLVVVLLFLSRWL